MYLRKIVEICRYLRKKIVPKYVNRKILYFRMQCSEFCCCSIPLRRKNSSHIVEIFLKYVHFFKNYSEKENKPFTDLSIFRIITKICKYG